MRIISGKYKGRKIYSVEGNTARPTTDFAREMLFSTLISLDVNMDNTLDLFAGSGCLGFEALSRGAKFVTFVESSKKAIATIFANAELLNCKDKCKIVIKKVETFCQSRDKETTGKYDLIFADPPYDKGHVEKTLKLIIEKKMLAEEGILVIEHSKKETIDHIYDDFIIKQKINGNTVLTFMSLCHYGWRSGTIPHTTD